MYRYSISTSKVDESGNFQLNLIIQIESGEGSMLKVEGIVTRDVWLDFSELGKHKKEDYPVFRPGDIHRVILAGLRAGWTPTEKGKPYILKLDNSFVKHHAIG